MKKAISLIATVLATAGIAGAQNYTIDPAPGAVESIPDGITIQFTSNDVTLADNTKLSFVSAEQEYTLYTYVMPRMGRVMIAPIDSNGDVIVIKDAGQYLLTAEEGAFTVAGQPSSYIEALYTITGNGTQNPETDDWSRYFTLQPTPGAYHDLTYIGIIFPYFANYAIASAEPITLEAPAGAPAMEQTADENGITLTFTSPATVEGEYKFTVPAGKFTVDGVPCPKISFSYTVDSTIQPAELMTFKPEPGEVPELSEIRLYFNGQWAQGNRSLKFKFTCDDPDTKVPSLRSGSNGDCYLFSFGDDAVITAPGTYRLFIPAGRFEINEQPSPEMTAVYTIVGGNEFPMAGIDPQPGSYAEIADGFTISLASTSLTVDESGITLSSGGTALPCRISTNNSDKITCRPLDADGNAASITKNGTYTLRVEAGAITADGIACNSMEFTYIIDSAQKPWEGTYTADPASGTEHEALSSVTLTFEGAEAVTLDETAGPADFPGLWDKQKTSKVCTVMCYTHENVIDISLSRTFNTPGEYLLVVPAKFVFVDGHNLAANIELTYIIKGEVASFEYSYSLSPAAGSKLSYTDAVGISFAAEGLASVTHDSMAWGKDAPHFTSADGYYCPGIQTVAGIGPNFTLRHEWPFENDGIYTLVIPAGYFTLTNTAGEQVKNAAITADYEVKAPSGTSLTASDEGTINVYDISGTLLIEAATDESLRTLRPGFYIVNGRKLFIR